MAPEVSEATGLRRLADQLQTLSELTESLTYRLLELEEKVAAIDLRLEPLLAGRSAEASHLSADTELRLDDTEERLARLESLLAGIDTVASATPIEADPHFPDGDFEQSFLDEPVFVAEAHEEAHDEDLDERLIA